MTEKKMDWDARYLTGDTPWEKGASAPALTHLVREGVFPVKGTILVPGCGTGHDVAYLANAGFETHGLDVSQIAIDRAQKTNAVERASYLHGDLFDLELNIKSTYDAIWEHTCYCAIHPSHRSDYIDSVSRLLRPEGIFVGLFFTNTQMPIGEGPPYETSRGDVIEMFSPNFTSIMEQKPQACYPGREGREWLMIWRRKA